MSGSVQLPDWLSERYELHEWRHAIAILATAFPKEWEEVLSVLEKFSLLKSWLTVGGGRKSGVSEWIDQSLESFGWVEKQFETAITVDQVTTESPTHQVDCFKNRIALEIEWNNKDPFFDRDLNNFRLLFDFDCCSICVPSV